MAKVTYRKLGMEDLELRYKWLTDSETIKYLGTRVRQGMTVEFHKQWMEEYLKDDKRQIYVMEVDGKPIGQVGLTSIKKEDKNSGLYIVIGEKDYRGKGYGKEAIKYILDYAFETLKLHKVWLEVLVENKIAINCYKKMGFVEEGYFKENIVYDDRYTDEIRMAIIKN